ncbi:MAG: ABC transporter permease [Candidatus Nanogingivalis sp.]|jgi:ABC-type antimicrobial peptide transporter
MKFLDMIGTSASNLWRNKGRTFLTVIAIFIGAFTITLTSAVNTGVNDYIERQLSIFGKENKGVQIVKKVEMNGISGGLEEYKEGETGGNQEQSIYSTPSLAKSDIEKLKKIEGLENVKPAENILGDYIEGANGKKFVSGNITSINENTDVKLDIKAGKDISTKNEAVISQDYIENLGFKNAENALGKTIKMQFSNQFNGEKKVYDFKISGVMNKNLVQNQLTVISNEFKKEILAFQQKNMPEAQKEKYFAATATLKPEFRNEEKLQMVKNAGDKEKYTITTYADQIKNLTNVVNAITGGLTVFGAIALLAASFGIINTLYMSVRERTREIGLMKAMGLSNGKIFQLFSIEAILIGVIGSILGIILASLAGVALNNFATANFLKGLEGFELTKFTLQNNTTITIAIAIVSFLAGALPARSASKKDPIEALRYE